MPEKLIVSQCAPVLAGIKTANLFNCEMESREALQQQIDEINARLEEKDLRMMVLSYPKGRALVYVYRPRQLRKDLDEQGIRRILEERGYEPQNMSLCISRLMDRLNNDADFPHEIGCFLGYPSDDIEGFIHHDRPRKCIGVWQVYGDEQAARKKFAMYRKCTDIYERQFENGLTLEDLTVDL